MKEYCPQCNRIREGVLFYTDIRAFKCPDGHKFRIFFFGDDRSYPEGHPTYDVLGEDHLIGSLEPILPLRKDRW